jgi:predicted methyltransferase
MAEPMKLEKALRSAARSLSESAVEHKRLEKHHREAAQRARDAERRLIETLAEFGIEVVRG